MNIHEYQAKSLLTRYGIRIPPYRVAGNIQDVMKAIKELGLTEGVVKAQVHAGGRGKAGGVKFGKNPEEIVRFAEQMIGMKFLQTSSMHKRRNYQV